MVDYYDQMLLAIVTVMIAGVAASIHPMVGVTQGLAGGSLAALLFLYEILFRNPPTEPTTSTTAAVVVAGVGWVLTLFLFI